MAKRFPRDPFNTASTPTLRAFESFGLLPLLALVVVAAFAGWSNERIFVWLNAGAPHWLSQLSRVLTHFGDAWLVCSLIIALLWRRAPATALSGLLGVLVSGAIVQLLKNFVFPHWTRPAGRFADQPEILAQIFLAPEHAHCCFTFPSGHSSTVFAAAAAALLGIRGIDTNYPAQALMGFWACTVALTRVWVGAHFPFDVATGATIGYVFSLLCVGLALRPLQDFFARRPLHHGPLGQRLSWLGWASVAIWGAWSTSQVIDY